MAGRGGIEAGGAFVRVGVKDETKTGLAGITSRLNSMAGSLASAGAKLGGIGAAITAPILAALPSWAAGGDALDKMSRRTGASVTALSELRYAANLSGTDIETVETALKKLSVAMHKADEQGAGNGFPADVLHGFTPSGQRPPRAARTFAGYSGLRKFPRLRTAPGPPL